MQNPNLLYLLLLSCLCFLVWGVSLAGAFLDVRRRGLPTTEQIAWLALVGFLPGLGLVAYLFARVLEKYFSPPAAPVEKKWETELYRVKEPDIRSGTIPALELISATVPEPADEYGLAEAQEAHEPRRILTLSVLAGPHRDEVFILTHLPAEIGRDPGSTIPLVQDRSISRLHAEIYELGGVVRLRDLRSTHGTQVNGFRIDDKALEPGDRIELGISVLMVEVD